MMSSHSYWREEENIRNVFVKTEFKGKHALLMEEFVFKLLRDSLLF